MRKIGNYLKSAGKFLLRHGRIWWLVIGILVGMLFNIMPMIMMMMGGPGGGGGMPSFPTAVEVATATRGTLDDTVTVAGSLQADEGTTLKSEVTGKVTALPLDEGTAVEKGAILVVLDDASTRANLAQAKAQANLAARNLDRLKKLRSEDPELVAQKDFDNALSSYEVARAAIDVAQAAFDKTHIAAPFAGTVGLRRVNVGDYVSPGQDLVSLQAMDVMKADFDLPERYAGGMAPGTPVKLSVDALGGETVSATVLAADPNIDPGTRTVAVRARVDNSGHNLRPGMFVRATATLNHKAAALTVPEESIVPEGNNKFVYKVVDKHAVKTPVTLGGRALGRVEITEGLVEGDVVVTGGTIKLSDGAEVVTTGIAVDGRAGVSGTTVSGTAVSATAPVSGSNPLMPKVPGQAVPASATMPVSATAVKG